MRSIAVSLTEQRQARRIIRELFLLQRSDPDWKSYLADHQRWRRKYDAARQALQRQHIETEIQPRSASGYEQEKVARLEADRKNLERWQESIEDLADEFLFKFERDNEEPSEEGTTKRRRNSRA
ncbi:hypothetical protein [Ilumatobacter sp.]|uniref:hypothetical protein n=1 Tax=Ilumatobacter sp. TaxID=1967498 RepID=UPI002A2AF633|nr:hypothetical protein [Ilumatobacter sp.]